MQKNIEVKMKNINAFFLALTLTTSPVIASNTEDRTCREFKGASAIATQVATRKNGDSVDFARKYKFVLYKGKGNVLTKDYYYKEEDTKSNPTLTPDFDNTAHPEMKKIGYCVYILKNGKISESIALVSSGSYVEGLK